MHPQNIFAEAVLLFVIAVLLFVRDRGSAMPSTQYDMLLAGVLMILSFVRLAEFMGGSQDGHILSRSIVWLMWLLPVIIFIWLTCVHRRLDMGVMLVLSICFLIVVTLMLITGNGGYDLVPPDQSVGTSNGVYHWIRTDGGLSFLPMAFYILLAVALVYLTALSIRDSSYWILAGATTVGFVLGAGLVAQVTKNPLATLGSLSTMVMLGVGMVAILMAPG